MVTGCNTNQKVINEREKTEIVFIVEKRDQEDNIDLRYPELRGMDNEMVQSKINYFLKEVVYGKVYDEFKPIPGDEEISYWSNYEVSYSDNNIISIIYNLLYYGKGAAHPNSFTYGVTANIESGEIYNVKDLFKKNSNYEKVINKRLKEEVEKLDISLFKPFEGLEDNQIFYLTEEGIEFVYQTYVYTPYAYGPLKLLIKYEDIKNILKMEL